MAGNNPSLAGDFMMISPRIETSVAPIHATSMAMNTSIDDRLGSLEKKVDDIAGIVKQILGYLKVS
jgi:hypothetical protein